MEQVQKMKKHHKSPILSVGVWIAFVIFIIYSISLLFNVSLTQSVVKANNDEILISDIE